VLREFLGRKKGSGRDKSCDRALAGIAGVDCGKVGKLLFEDDGFSNGKGHADWERGQDMVENEKTQAPLAQDSAKVQAACDGMCGSHDVTGNESEERKIGQKTEMGKGSSRGGLPHKTMRREEGELLSKTVGTKRGVKGRSLSGVGATMEERPTD